MEHAPQHVEVLDPVDRLLHAAALLGGGGALATGPLLEVPALAAAIGVDGGAMSLVHAFAGVLAALAWTFHLARVCLGWLEGRNPWGLMPRPRDGVDLLRGLAWNLGLSQVGPPAGRFSYRERLAYGALMSALPILVGTGWAIAHPLRSHGLLGADSLVAAARLHAALGLLLLPLIFWHLYFASLRPAALFWNGAWLTGREPWSRLRRMRPDWAEELVTDDPTGMVSEVQPRSVEDLLSVGNQAGREGRFAEAEEAYLEALAAYPGYGQALFNLGVVRFRSGDRPGAVTALSEFLDSDPFGPMALRAEELLGRLRDEETPDG